MAETPWTDPVALWRDMLDKMERQFNEAGNKVMGQEQFSAAVNKASVLPLAMQKSLNDAMAKYFATLNLPTRDDIIALGERLGHVERELHRLSAALAPPPVPAAPSPPRTRKPKPAAPADAQPKAPSS
jgi:hypothetical protein